MARKKWGVRKMPYEVGRAADPLSQRASRQAFLLLVDLMVLLVTVIIQFYVWLFKLIIQGLIWLWKLTWKVCVYAAKKIQAWLDSCDEIGE